jgi:stage V sporulation protein B
MIFQALVGTFAVFVAMGLGYVFHFFMTRNLSPDLYGELSIIMGLLTILAVPTSGIQTVLTREIAKLDKKGNREAIIFLLRKYSKIILLGGVGTGAVLFFSSQFIAGMYGNSDLVLPIQVLSAGITGVFLLPIVRAYYQGLEKIKSISALMILEPLFKVGIGAALVFLGFGLLGATSSLWIGAIILCLLLVPIFLCKIRLKNYSLNLNKSFLYILITSALFTIFFFLDLFFVRYFLTAEQTGFYNVASITSKVLFYAAFGINVVLLPKSSKLDLRKDKIKIKTMIMKSIYILVPIFVIFMIFPSQIISTFYTEKYLVAVYPFIILSIGMLFFGIFKLLTNVMWSQHMEIPPLVISAIALVIDAILLMYLIPIYGLMGAALATAITSIFFFSGSLISARKFF